MSGKKRAAGQNASGNASGAGGAAKRAKAAAAPKRKTKAVLTAGLLEALPDQPGPWLQRCIERWGLVAPYDPSITEAQWESYFKERAALEWHTDSFLAKVHSGEDKGEGKEEGEDEKDEEQQGQQAAGQWPFDWAQPQLGKFCRECYVDNEAEELHGFLEAARSGVQRVLGGCKGVEGVAGLAEGLAGGLFITFYWVNWEDYDTPRTLEISTRLYSPCALATSIDFRYHFHCRARMSFSEHFCHANVASRGPADTCPEYPHRSSAPQQGRPGRGAAFQQLFSMEEQDSGYQKRKTMGPQALKALGAHLLGRKGLISDRKVLSLAALAAGTKVARGAEIGWLFRVIRRKHKLAAGEESDAAPDGYDSGNEGLKKARSQYNDWDDDPGYDVWDERAVMAEHCRRKGYPPECHMM